MQLRSLPRGIRRGSQVVDSISRWDGLEVYSQATAATATRLLDALEARMPFPIRALQVDGGSEFAAGFEEACQRRGLRLFVLPPRSPKLNGHVERAQRTHTEEFYECYEGEVKLSAFRPALRAWEDTSNHVRPHQALGYLTPAEFLVHHGPRGPTSHMC